MRFVKLSVLLLVWSFFFVWVALLHLAVSILGAHYRWRMISRATRRFAALLRTLLKIKIILEGEAGLLKSGGHFIVSNHVSYVDGIILGSLFPLVYVTKKEVRGWPIIGQWTALVGTVYVDRDRKDKAPLFMEEMAERLRQKSNVLVFPEGTSTNGEKLLPFQSAHFAAPLMARAPVVPVTLTYRSVNGEPLSAKNRDVVFWYGEMEFVSHFWNLLGVRGVEVTVQIHPRIETSGTRDDSFSRRQLSQACHDIISGQSLEKEERAGIGLTRQA